MGLVDDVQRYYQEARISPTDFHCLHEDECRVGCAHFTQAREPYVGREYERGAHPRLLFLSLDPGSIEDADPDKRTTRWLQQVEGEGFLRDPSQWWRNGRHVDRHWMYTYKLAFDLLQPLVPELAVVPDVRHYFAHTNSAKCCMNNPGRREAAWRLFDNCRSFVEGELAVLRPDILVTQGVAAREVVRASSFVCRKMASTSCPYSVLDLEGRQVIWFHTYHPSYYRRFFSQKKECWPVWARAAKEFMESQEDSVSRY